MAVLKSESYEWYSYKAKDVHLFESGRGQEGSLLKGQFFGLRKAGSKKGVHRLILKELGPGVVFSLSEKEVQGLLKKSLPMKGVRMGSDPLEKKLRARLAKADVKDFWSVVAALEWPKAGKNPRYAQTVLAVLREDCKSGDVKRLFQVAVKKRRELQKAVEKFEKKAGRQLYLGGDDSFYDALAQAVSMGKKSFDGFLKRPESFVKRFNRGGVHSNFESCFD